MVLGGRLATKSSGRRCTLAPLDLQAALDAHALKAIGYSGLLIGKATPKAVQRRLSDLMFNRTFDRKAHSWLRFHVPAAGAAHLPAEDRHDKAAREGIQRGLPVAGRRQHVARRLAIATCVRRKRKHRSY